MKSNGVTLGLLFCSILACQGQVPPPNDNFSDRIVLTGTDISFDGTLNGATRESPFEILPPSVSIGVNQTVWWEWTSPQATTVIVQILNPSQSTVFADALEVYKLVNIQTGQFVAGIPIDTRWPQMFFTFQAQAGTNYQIQLAGGESASFSFRLIATNLPYIIEQPQPQTISADDSVLFTVTAAGLKPFSYQWQFNEIDLPGETAPMLALDHVLTNQAGAYRVIITNSAGITISDTVNLEVTAADTAAQLSARSVPTNGQFAFALLGDIGRRYRVQSSDNLLDWVAESSFPSITFYDAFPFALPLRSVVSDLTGADSFVVPQAGSQRFYRVTPFHAANEVCNNNLKQIRFAQLLYSYDDGTFSPVLSVTVSKLLPYLKNAQWPLCPSNGNYSVFSIRRNPSCSTGIHPLEER